MFVDEVTVYLKAGDGGDGCLSFRRAKFEPKGGPNGGNGGKGGDVILLGDENTADLTDYKYVPHARAKNGENGRGSDQQGAMGANKELRMPLGTIIMDAETDEVLGELTKHGQRIVLLEGGRGGVGNKVFKSSVNQAPRKTTAGKKGGEGRYRLVLKTIADLGLVGFPNAGKSSLTGLLTSKQPKVGHYPFTTLQPSVGVIDYPDHYQRLTLADIPGIIEGAHENRGLGHRFLRHIERCRYLLFILDLAGEDGRDPLDDFAQLKEELGHYDPSLLEKPRLVLGNKIDEEAAVENLKRFKKRFKKETILPISCLGEDGIAQLKEILRQKLAPAPKVTTPQGVIAAEMPPAEPENRNTATAEGDKLSAEKAAPKKKAATKHTAKADSGADLPKKPAAKSGAKKKAAPANKAVAAETTEEAAPKAKAKAKAAVKKTTAKKTAAKKVASAKKSAAVKAAKTATAKPAKSAKA